MTPKEQYEARKTERKANARTHENLGHSSAQKDEFFMDAVDRFVTAFERIAEALEKRQ